MAPGTKRISIPVRPGPVPGRPYDVRVGFGLGPEIVGDLRDAPLGERYALITDDRVEALHAGKLASSLRDAGLTVDLLAFPNGEASKTRETKAALEDRLVELGLGRDGAVIAVGGGVVGDMAGFVAASYHRGIPWVQVPTTLLAMVDASVGGKTGHDLPSGKNLVGAFHQPAAVYADLDTLHTLPDPEIDNGFAEVIKHGLIADAELVGFLEAHAGELRRRDQVRISRAVCDSVRIKAELVSRDPGEAGMRALLNFGHTVGHAVEAVSEFRIPHGEAVAIGMVVEADLSVSSGLLPAAAIQRLECLLASFELPARVPPDLPVEEMLGACARDKKARRGGVRCVLLRDLGKPAEADGGWTHPVSREDLEKALRRAREE